MRRRVWIVLVCAAVALGVALFFVLAAAQTGRVVTVQDLYALLTTPTGENRLEVMADMLHDIDQEVDVIHTQAQKMMADEAAQLEGQKWSLEDMRYFLEMMDAKLSAIESRLDALEARSVGCP
jgi:hypothetical protein